MARTALWILQSQGQAVIQELLGEIEPAGEPMKAVSLLDLGSLPVGTMVFYDLERLGVYPYASTNDNSIVKSGHRGQVLSRINQGTPRFWRDEDQAKGGSNWSPVQRLAVRNGVQSSPDYNEYVRESGLAVVFKVRGRKQLCAPTKLSRDPTKSPLLPNWRAVGPVASPSVEQTSRIKDRRGEATIALERVTHLFIREPDAVESELRRKSREVTRAKASSAVRSTTKAVLQEALFPM